MSRTYTEKRICAVCGGTGIRPPRYQTSTNASEPCPACGGQGIQIVTVTEE